MQQLWFFFTLIIATAWPAIASAQSADAMAARERLRACAIAEDPACFEREALAGELAWGDQAFVAARVAEQGDRERAAELMQESLDAEVEWALEIRPHYLSFVTDEIALIANYAQRTGLTGVAHQARQQLLRLSVRYGDDERGNVQTCGDPSYEDETFVISLSGPDIYLAAWAAEQEMHSGNFPEGYSAVQFVAGTAFFTYFPTGWDRQVPLILELFRDTGLESHAGPFLEGFMRIFRAHNVNCDLSTELVGIYAAYPEMFSDTARTQLIEYLIEYGETFPLEPLVVRGDYYYPDRKLAWLEVADLLEESPRLNELYASQIAQFRVEGERLPLPHPAERDLIELIAPGYAYDGEVSEVEALIDDDPFASIRRILSRRDLHDALLDQGRQALRYHIDYAMCRGDREAAMQGLALEGLFVQRLGYHLSTAATYFVLGEDHLAYQQILAEIERLPITHRENLAYSAQMGYEETDFDMLGERSAIAAVGMAGMVHNRTPFEPYYEYREQECRPGTEFDYLPPF